MAEMEWRGRRRGRVQAGRLRSSGMPTQSVAAADRMRDRSVALQPVLPAPSGDAGRRRRRRNRGLQWRGLSAARVQMRFQASLPRCPGRSPKGHAEGAASGHPGHSQNPPPAPARAADRPTPTARFCMILQGVTVRPAAGYCCICANQSLPRRRNHLRNGHQPPRLFQMEQLHHLAIHPDRALALVLRQGKSRDHRTGPGQLIRAR